MKLELCSYPTASAISLMRSWLRVKRSAAFCILFSLSKWPRQTPVCCLNKCRRCEWLRLSSSANSSIVQGGLDAIIPRILWTRSSYAVGIDISGGAGCACDLRAFEEFDLVRFFFGLMMRQFQSDTETSCRCRFKGFALVCECAQVRTLNRVRDRSAGP